MGKPTDAWLRSGAGPHGDRRTKRQRQRGQAARAAIEDNNAPSKHDPADRGPCPRCGDSDPFSNDGVGRLWVVGRERGRDYVACTNGDCRFEEVR